ncbi:MAG: hypothetical protein KKB25_01625 [Nanoarchaeota archaeon]|nr:hypothetical protein [Nanoarchaeota archaeon]
MVYKYFQEVDDSWKDSVRHGIDALKHGWSGVARDCAKKAEKDFLSIKGSYDRDIAEIYHSDINALKGLTYYSLKNTSQDAEYAHTLILRKQLMRRIKKDLKEPLKSAIERLNWIAFNDIENNRPTFLNSMKNYNRFASQLKNEEYDSVISEINGLLAECGVGKK